MTISNKLLWAEGILLGQQHFQQWDNYLETLARERFFVLKRDAWGVVSMKIDESALEYGQFVLLQCKVIMPNGQLIDLPQSMSYELPQVHHESIPVYLCVPQNKDVANLNGYDCLNELAAWQTKYIHIEDEYDPQRSREVIFAQPNIYLVSTTVSEQACCYLKIAEIQNVQDSQYKMVCDYIPATVDCNVNTWLQQQRNRLLQAIQHKLNQLINQKQDAQIDHRMVQHRVTLHALLLAYNALKQMSEHPKLFYETCVGLLSTLLIWQSDYSEMEIPEYQHKNLNNTFHPLLARLNQLLTQVAITPLQELTLKREGERIFSVSDIAANTFADARWYLLVDYQAEDMAWVTEFSKCVKCGSAESINIIVASALSGVKLEFVVNRPEKLAVKTAHACFQLMSAGPFWEQVIAHRSLGIFLVDPFKDAKITLKLIKTSSL